VFSVSGTYPNQSVLDWRKMTVLNEDYEFCINTCLYILLCSIMKLEYRKFFLIKFWQNYRKWQFISLYLLYVKLGGKSQLLYNLSSFLVLSTFYNP
jgi:hypothetical protein